MGRFSRQREAARHKAQLRPGGPGHPIENFFASYNDFTFNRSAPSWEEFKRLRMSQGWKRGDREGDMAWGAFRLALVKEFNTLFGTDGRDLLAWQTLCTIVGIENVRQITSCDECEKHLKSRYFNLVDVVDA